MLESVAHLWCGELKPSKGGKIFGCWFCCFIWMQRSTNVQILLEPNSTSFRDMMRQLQLRRVQSALSDIRSQQWPPLNNKDAADFITDPDNGKFLPSYWCRIPGISCWWGLNMSGWPVLVRANNRPGQRDDELNEDGGKRLPHLLRK